MMNTQTKLLLAVGGGIAGYLVLREIAARFDPHTVAKATVHAAGQAATGAVIGAGKVIGIPETDEQKCRSALCEGRTLDASFFCPAGTFLSWQFKSAAERQVDCLYGKAKTDPGVSWDSFT